MNLEEITAEIRPRTRWESVDLGVALTRRHFRALAVLWLATVMPVWLLLVVLLRGHPLWCLVLIVWLRPLYERPILHYLSRALFNAAPPVRAVLRGYFGIVAPGLLYSLTLARFSLTRSFLLPLHVLERVKGARYRSRRAALMAHGGGTATWLTFMCAALEVVLAVALIFFLLGFIPEQLSPDWGEAFSAFVMLEDFRLPLPLAWFAVAVFLVAMTFVDIFYVGCGFGLYLNGRSHIEGWDIEITFRRLAEKIRSRVPRAGAAAWVGAALVAGLTCAPQAPAQDPVKERIGEILADEDFTIHTEVRRDYVDGGEGASQVLDPSLAGAFAAIGELLFWLVVLAAFAGLAWLVYANRHLFARGEGGGADDGSAKRTKTVMGLDVASETLPDNIPAAALAAWQRGEAQLATSLLYRGAICWLVEVAQLPLHSSDTESDCLAHASQVPDAGKREYFRALTGEWVRTAYGDDSPEEARFRELCSAWPFHLEGGAA